MGITQSQLRGTAGMERFRLAIVSIRNEGVVMCSDYQMYSCPSATYRNRKRDDGASIERFGVKVYCAYANLRDKSFSVLEAPFHSIVMAGECRN